MESSEDCICFHFIYDLCAKISNFPPPPIFYFLMLWFYCLVALDLRIIVSLRQCIECVTPGFSLALIFHPLLLSDLPLFYSLGRFFAFIGSEQLFCSRPVISAKRHLNNPSFFFTTFSSLPFPSVPPLRTNRSPLPQVAL